MNRKNTCVYPRGIPFCSTQMGSVLLPGIFIVGLLGVICVLFMARIEALQETSLRRQKERMAVVEKHHSAAMILNKLSMNNVTTLTSTISLAESHALTVHVAVTLQRLRPFNDLPTFLAKEQTDIWRGEAPDNDLQGIFNRHSLTASRNLEIMRMVASENRKLLTELRTSHPDIAANLKAVKFSDAVCLPLDIAETVLMSFLELSAQQCALRADYFTFKGEIVNYKKMFANTSDDFEFSLILPESAAEIPIQFSEPSTLLSKKPAEKSTAIRQFLSSLTKTSSAAAQPKDNGFNPRAALFHPDFQQLTMGNSMSAVTQKISPEMLFKPHWVAFLETNNGK